jgi:hypothetical protein
MQSNRHGYQSRGGKQQPVVGADASSHGLELILHAIQGEVYSGGAQCIG